MKSMNLFSDVGAESSEALFGNSKPKKKTYSENFKKKAVKLASGIGVAKAAEELGVSTSSIYSWQNTLGTSTLAKNNLAKKLPPAPIQDENSNLTFELEGKTYSLNVNSEKERERVKKEVNANYLVEYGWFKEKTGKKHWVFYNTKMYEICNLNLKYREDSDLAPIVPINATSCYGTFFDCKKLTSIDLSNFNTRNVTDMNNMFYNCKRLTSLNLNGFDTSTLSLSPERQQNSESLLHFGHGKYDYEVNVNSKESREKLKRTFNEQHNAHYDWFKEKIGKKHWVFYNTEMYIIRSGGLRYNEDSDLAPILPINASSCCDMFRGCITLERLDLSHFRTENIVTMMSMFRGCHNLKELDLSNFNTENVINMSRMFEDCTKLTTISVKDFNTVNTISMANIFQNCKSLIILDLLSFDTSNVKSFANFFNGCKSLKRIYVSPKWVTGEYIDNCFVFDGCVNLPHFSQDRINYEMLVDVKDGGYLTVVK